MIEFVPLPGISFGPLALNAHGLLILVGVVVAYIVFSKRTSDRQLMAIKDSLLVVLVISGIIGARLLYVLTNMDIYAANPLDAIKIWEGGISLSGGIIFATLSAYIYLKKKGINFLKAADSLVIPVVAGSLIGRLGDLLTWDHPGTYSELPWAFVVNGQSQHPVIAYEMLGLAVILGILLALSKRKAFEGKMFFLYLGFYGALRFTTDNFRAEAVYFGIRQAQIIGLAFVLVSIIAMIACATKKASAKSAGVAKEV